MGKIFPQNSELCLRLSLLALKTYITSAGICFLIGVSSVGKLTTGFGDPLGKIISYEQARICTFVVYGYLVCIALLIIVSFQNKKVRRAALIFAGIGFLITCLLAPAASVPATKF